MILTMFMIYRWEKNDVKTAGDPHKPLRQQLVPHSLHHLPPSSHILQVEYINDQIDYFEEFYMRFRLLITGTTFIL